MNWKVIAYWIFTGLLCATMLFSVGLYFFDHANVAAEFEHLGYPTYLIYPLAIAKILAVGVILSRRFTILKEWAYAGFCYDLLLAMAAHVMVQDDELAPAVIAFVAWLGSYLFDKLLAKDK